MVGGVSAYKAQPKIFQFVLKEHKCLTYLWTYCELSLSMHVGYIQRCRDEAGDSHLQISLLTDKFTRHHFVTNET